MKIKILLITLIVLFIQSCTIQKRFYRKGFTIESNNSSGSTSSKKIYKENKKELVSISTIEKDSTEFRTEDNTLRKKEKINAKDIIKKEMKIIIPLIDNYEGNNIVKNIVSKFNPKNNKTLSLEEGHFINTVGYRIGIAFAIILMILGAILSFVSFLAKENSSATSSEKSKYTGYFTLSLILAIVNLVVLIILAAKFSDVKKKNELYTISQIDNSRQVKTPEQKQLPDYEDVIYLKNGSVIRGIIIEQDLQNKTLKIETREKNIFVYKMEEIDIIKKETPKQ